MDEVPGLVLPSEAEMHWQDRRARRIPSRVNHFMCSMTLGGTRYPLAVAFVAVALRKIEAQKRARILEGVRCFFWECERLDLKGLNACN